jgi:hypothetical protein
VRVPFHFATDAECLRAAFRLAGVAPETARILRIKDTLALEDVVASSNYADEIDGRDDLQVMGPPEPWSLANLG